MEEFNPDSFVLYEDTIRQNAHFILKESSTQGNLSVEFIPGKNMAQN